MLWHSVARWHTYRPVCCIWHALVVTHVPSLPCPPQPSSGLSFYSTSVANLLGQAFTTPSFVSDQSQVIFPCASSSGDGMVHVVDLARHSFSTVHLPKWALAAADVVPSTSCCCAWGGCHVNKCCTDTTILTYIDIWLEPCYSAVYFSCIHVGLYHGCPFGEDITSCLLPHCRTPPSRWWMRWVVSLCWRQGTRHCKGKYACLHIRLCVQTTHIHNTV